MHDPWFDGLFYAAILGIFMALLMIGLGIAYTIGWLLRKWRNRADWSRLGRPHR